MDIAQQVWEVVYPVWEEQIRALGWLRLLLALAYVAAAVGCGLCAVVSRDTLDEDWGWQLAALLLVLLAVNSLLFLDQLASMLLREGIRLSGWYEERRVVQFAVVALAIGVVLPLMAWVRTRLSAVWPACGKVVLGVALLGLLVAARLVSFHETDALLQMDLGVAQLQQVLEFLGLVWVGLGVRDWLTRY